MKVELLLLVVPFNRTCKINCGIMIASEQLICNEAKRKFFSNATTVAGMRLINMFCLAH